MRTLGVILIIFFILKVEAQKNDHVWIIGGNSINFFFNGFQWGTAIADFKEEPVQFRYDSTITMDLQGTNGIISDNDGNLLMYSNGMHVHNRYHQVLPGLDTISYSKHWENFNSKEYLPDGSDWKSGLPGSQWLMMLPGSDDKKYFIFHPYVEITQGPLFFSKLLTSAVIFDDANMKGSTIHRDSVVKEGVFKWGINAVRHGNGRDWWLIHGTISNESFEVYLLGEKGIRWHHQESKMTTSPELSYYQGYFSTRGDKYVTAEGIGVEDTILVTIYDFDRCTGELMRSESKVFNNRKIFYGVLMFSPDGRYLYITEGLNMYQYDMDADPVFSSERKVAEYDGTIDTYYRNELIFSSMAIGPDGRIYCIPPGNTRSIHTIEYPEEEGEAATMLQNSIKLPIKNFNSIPNLPHFRLGSADGSPCDTLGIDNMPVAKFRYEQDTVDYLHLRFTDLSYFRAESWEWDFGDGTTFTARKPYWHTFPKAGTYHVCLQVSNENGQDTYCKTIQLGTIVATDNGVLSTTRVNLFPNPAEDDVMVTLSDYVPQSGSIEIYDVLGQLVLQKKIYYGQNALDVSGLSSGTYVYKVIDKSRVISKGTLIKM